MQKQMLKLFLKNGWVIKRSAKGSHILVYNERTKQSESIPINGNRYMLQRFIKQYNLKEV